MFASRYVNLPNLEVYLNMQGISHNNPPGMEEIRKCIVSNALFNNVRQAGSVRAKFVC
jgi:hypothetical protein